VVYDCPIVHAEMADRDLGPFQVRGCEGARFYFYESAFLCPLRRGYLATSLFGKDVIHFYTMDKEWH
jgi:hypothetical protein